MTDGTGAQWISIFNTGLGSFSGVNNGFAYILESDAKIVMVNHSIISFLLSQ